MQQQLLHGAERHVRLVWKASHGAASAATRNSRGAYRASQSVPESSAGLHRHWPRRPLHPPGDQATSLTTEGRSK